MTPPLLRYFWFHSTVLLPHAVCSLRSAVCSLQSAVCSLRSAVCGLRSAVCGLRSAVCSLQSGVCKCHTPVSADVLKRAGQHSLTSVERPSYRRSDFVKVWRHARLEYALQSAIYLGLVWILVRDFVPLFRSFLDWFQSIQTRRCHCLRLQDVLMFQASSYSAGKRTFQWMLLNNILWMAPDHQAVYLGDNYTLSLSLLNTCTV